MKFIKFILFIIFTYGNVAFAEQVTEWDFDHRIQFTQEKLGENRYQLLIHRVGGANFNRMSTFLVRRGLNLCKSYGYQIKVLNGVEDFYDRRRMPNRIFGSLSAIITCEPET